MYVLKEVVWCLVNERTVSCHRITWAFCLDGEGLEALRAAYAKWKPTRPQRHLVVNTLVTDWNGDEANAISDVVFALRADSGWAIQLVGRYHDTLHRDDRTWRFHHRSAEFVT